MKNKSKVRWITQTAIFIALLIVLQMVTAPLGNTLITGSIVNMLLIVSVMSCGPSSSLAVAVISPVVAKFLGIGPLWMLIPFIALGNIILVLVWHFIGNRKIVNKYVSYVIALIAAAGAKFAVLYFGIVKIAVPLILGLPEPQAGVISGLFSVPQLITASIGGVLAILIFPTLKKAVNRKQS